MASYGLPKAGEIDPSAIMSFFYIVFFGLMLSDAAYGVLVFIACAVIIKKFPGWKRGCKRRFECLCTVDSLQYFGD